jgi:hypothetical protein
MPGGVGASGASARPTSHRLLAYHVPAARANSALRPAPYGDHVGEKSSASLLVRLTLPLPAELITQISASPGNST